jgi:hypothetical protein
MKVTRKPDGGWGELSSPSILRAFLLNMPIFFIKRLSCAEIFDLSHTEILVFSTRSSVHRASFLHCLERRAMAEVRPRKQRGSRGCVREVLEEEEGHREKDGVRRNEEGKMRTRVKLIGRRRYDQPSDEKGRILNPTRVKVVEWSFQFNFTEGKLPRACREFRRMCAPHLRDVEEVQNFGPTEQWFVGSHVFPR